MGAALCRAFCDKFAYLRWPVNVPLSRVAPFQVPVRAPEELTVPWKVAVPPSVETAPNETAPDAETWPLTVKEKICPDVSNPVPEIVPSVAITRSKVPVLLPLKVPV